ncbi:MAG: gas vesicle protein [Planctomycetota bacterium]
MKLRRRTAEPSEPSTVAAPSDVTLTETLDRVLARGVVANAEVVLAVADIPLVYVGLQALVSSVETARQLAADANGLGEANHSRDGAPSPSHRRGAVER